jgi:S-adenosylhomocysteine hydrolase
MVRGATRLAILDQLADAGGLHAEALVQNSEARSASDHSSGQSPREDGDRYEAGVHEVPDDLDREIAEIKLDAEGVEYDELTPEQEEYMGSWQHGT